MFKGCVLTEMFALCVCRFNPKIKHVDTPCAGEEMPIDTSALKTAVFEEEGCEAQTHKELWSKGLGDLC